VKSIIISRKGIGAIAGRCSRGLGCWINRNPLEFRAGL